MILKIFSVVSNACIFHAVGTLEITGDDVDLFSSSVTP